MSKSILVVGASSAFAQEVIPVLAQDNTVITAGRKDCDVYCDVAKEVPVPDDIDVLINFAAAFGGNSDEKIEEAFRTNVLGTLNVCEGARKAGVGHVILVSSVSALQDTASPYYSSYAITKRHADELASFYCKTNTLPLTILRPSQIYGNSSHLARHQPFMYAVIEQAQKGEDITIYGSHDPLRNYIHVDDLSEIIRRVIEGQVEGTYACVSPTNVSYSQIAQAAQKMFAQGGKVVYLKDKPDIPDNIFALDLSLYDKIDYAPKVTLEAGLQKIKEFKERDST